MDQGSNTTSRWLIRGSAGLVFLNGCLALFRPLAQRIPERIESLFIPFSYDYLARSFDIFVGLALIYLSYQLFQRKKNALLITVIALSAVIGNTILNHTWPEALVPCLALAVLILNRNYFRAESETRSIRAGILVLVSSILLAIIYGTLGFYLMFRRDFGVDFTLVQALRESLRALLSFGNYPLAPQTRYAHWFIDSLQWIGVLAVGYGLYSLFRPLDYRYRTLPMEHDRALQLLRTQSRSSEDFFKIWPNDKSYFFSSDGQAFLAYTVRNGVAIVAGDPIGPAESIREILKEFGQFCLHHDWLIAFLYVSESWLDEFTASGLQILKIGEDAIVDTGAFMEQTARDKNFRNIRNRFNKLGYTAENLDPPHSDEFLAELQEVSTEWLSQSGKREWSFFAGSFSFEYLQKCRLVIVRDSEGRAQAFANYMPQYQKRELTIDLMRYRLDAPTNVMDYLFCELIGFAKDQGYQNFSLGLAPFSGIKMAGSKPEEKFLHLAYEANRLVSFKGLRQFKAKFRPNWSPKYAAYTSGVTSLPQIIYALNKLL